MNSLILLLFGSVVGFLAYKAGVIVEHERGRATFNALMREIEYSVGLIRQQMRSIHDLRELVSEQMDVLASTEAAWQEDRDRLTDRSS